MLSFDNLIRTTRTVVADSNLVIDKDRLFDILPISEYCVPEKRRGRKKGEPVEQPVRNLSSGSIIFAGYGNRIKGVSPKGSTTTFKNSVTIVMVIKGRLVNFKLTQNGRFHITGNNDNYHIEKCIKHMWKFIQQYPDIYVVNGTSVKVTVWPSMVNMKTNIGFRLDRQELNTYVNAHTEYISMFETSSGSASVNIKMPLAADTLVLNTLTFRSGKWVRGTTSVEMQVVSKPKPRRRALKPKAPLEEAGAKESERAGKMTDMSGRFVTFLVFHTGEVIMSSLDQQLMEPYFAKFVDILAKCRDQISVE